MSQMGIGAMLSHLGGNSESVRAFTLSFGKVLTALALGTDDNLRLTFADGSVLRIYDDGQSCCESRYMRTDDDLAYHVGATFLNAETRNAPDIETEYDVHEVQFLELTTSKGVISMASHNEHNGYYGGISVRGAFDVEPPLPTPEAS